MEPADLQMERMNTSRIPAGVIKDMSDAIGKRINHNTKAGDYFRQNMLSVPPLVRKGDKVKLEAKSDCITIITVGIAKSSGGAGEQINIENISSKKAIVGKVKDASTVEIVF